MMSEENRKFYVHRPQARHTRPHPLINRRGKFVNLLTRLRCVIMTNKETKFLQLESINCLINKIVENKKYLLTSKSQQRLKCSYHITRFNTFKKRQKSCTKDKIKIWENSSRLKWKRNEGGKKCNWGLVINSVHLPTYKVQINRLKTFHNFQKYKTMLYIKLPQQTTELPPLCSHVLVNSLDSTTFYST